MMDKPDAPQEGEEREEFDALKAAQDIYAVCVEAERQNHDEAKDDIRFARLGQQWDEELKRQRAQDGRPCLTINKLPPFIRQVVNDARQNKPQIKVLPQDSGADPETAEIFSGLIRNIETSSSADVAYDTAIDNAATCGFGFFRVNLEYACDDAWDQDVVIERVQDPFCVHPDPYSTSVDGSDWNHCFVTELLSEAEFERRYPDANPIDFNSTEYPRNWIVDNQVMVAEYWRREEVVSRIILLTSGEVIGEEEFAEVGDELAEQGVFPTGQTRDVRSYKVMQYILTGVEVLEENEWAGKYIPIVPVYGEEVVYEGKRYFRSLIRDAKDAQVMYNAWRTASTELVALAPKAPYIGPEGTFDVDVEKWARANTATHAFIEYKDKGIPPQRQPFAGVPAGALQEALNASDDMKAIIGIYDSSLGARSNETSGKAIIARQRESDVSTFHFIDNLTRSIRQCGRILIDLIPKVYGPDRVIRVLGEDERDARTVALGGPEDVQQNRMMREQDESIPPIYTLAAGKYDLTVSSGPSYSTLRQESANQMIELIRAYPAAAPLIGDLLAKNLDWPGADEIARRLEAAAQQQPQPEGGDPSEMAQMQIEAAKAQQEAGVEAEKLRLDWFKAETDRIKVQLDARAPRGFPEAPGL